MRWENAGLHALYKLQDGMCVYTSGKEEESSQRVCRNYTWTCLGDVLMLGQGEIHRGPRESLGTNGKSTQTLRFVYWLLLVGMADVSRHFDSR